MKIRLAAAGLGWVVNIVTAATKAGPLVFFILLYIVSHCVYIHRTAAQSLHSRARGGPGEKKPPRVLLIYIATRH